MLHKALTSRPEIITHGLYPATPAQGRTVQCTCACLPLLQATVGLLDSLQAPAVQLTRCYITYVAPQNFYRAISRPYVELYRESKCHHWTCITPDRTIGVTGKTPWTKSPDIIPSGRPPPDRISLLGPYVGQNPPTTIEHYCQ